MKSSLKLFTLVFACGVWAGGALADLQGDIKRILSDRLLAKSTTGVEVVKLTENPGDCHILYEMNSHVPLTPASNMKVVTVSATLHVLTPQFRYRTMVVQRGEDLIIWGDGDPTLGDYELMDQIGWSQTAVFDEWANQIAKAKIATVRNVVVDDSIFDEQYLHPRWEKHQFMPSGAAVGGLNFNVNTVEFTITERKGGGTAAWSIKPFTRYINVVSNACVGGGSNNAIITRPANSNDFSLKGSVDRQVSAFATVFDPPMYAGNVFADVLRAKGIKITGQVLRDRTTRGQYAAADAKVRDQQFRVISVCETPLPKAITRCMKDSMNLYAEAFCKRIGATTEAGGTWDSGHAVTAEFLQKLGVNPKEFRLDDGSGLSRDNLMTVNAMIRCLLFNYYSSHRDIFLESLPIGGVDGTLRKRFDGSLRGRVFAKTGFIANVSALSGYLKAKNGEMYAFSIIMNGIPDLSNSSIKPLQEQIVEAIDNSAGD